MVFVVVCPGSSIPYREPDERRRGWDLSDGKKPLLIACGSDPAESRRGVCVGGGGERVWSVDDGGPISFRARSNDPQPCRSRTGHRGEPMASGDWLVVCQGRRRALRFAWASMLLTFCLFCSWKRSLSVDDRVVTVLVVSCFFFRLFSFWSRFAGTRLRGSCPWQDAASRV